MLRGDTLQNARGFPKAPAVRSSSPDTVDTAEAIDTARAGDQIEDFERTQRTDDIPSFSSPSAKAGASYESAKSAFSYRNPWQGLQGLLGSIEEVPSVAQRQQPAPWESTAANDETRIDIKSIPNSPEDNNDEANRHTPMVNLEDIYASWNREQTSMTQVQIPAQPPSLRPTVIKVLESPPPQLQLLARKKRASPSAKASPGSKPSPGGKVNPNPAAAATATAAAAASSSPQDVRSQPKFRTPPLSAKKSQSKQYQTHNLASVMQKKNSAVGDSR